MACAWSVALHAAVLVIAVRIGWQAAERRPVEPESVVWLGDLLVAERAALVPAPPAPEPELVPDSDPPGDTPPPDAEPAQVPETEETAPPEPLPEPAVEPPSQAPAEAAPAASAEADPSRPAEPQSPQPDPSPVQLDSADAPRNYVVTQADLEDAWRRAREEMREQLEQEGNYRTFSFDDLIEAPPPEEPGPSESIFERAERYGGGGAPSVLSPGQARTRAGRALAEFCNALTGGFSVMGIATVCAERGESPRLFAHIKPAYLRSRPVCTEVVPVGGTADGEPPTIKCELVEQEEDDPR